MELTIEQALQRGIVAHRAGNLEEAERLYRAILGSHPNHPDANHNLGVLAVTVSQFEASLPFFKTALEANPDQEQFWYSYIDALIRLDKTPDAKQVLEQGRDRGLKGVKFDELASSLGVLSRAHLSLEDAVSGLLNLYKLGKLEEALSHGNALCVEFPTDPSILNILGAINSSLGNDEEVIANYTQAIELQPDNSVSHYNLGVALAKQDKNEQAIDSYNTAIKLKPEFAEAYNNLGSAFRDLDRNEEAITSYNTAIELKPDYASVYSYLGNTFKKVEKFDEAIVNYKKSIRY